MRCPTSSAAGAKAAGKNARLLEGTIIVTDGPFTETKEMLP